MNFGKALQLLIMLFTLEFFDFLPSLGTSSKKNRRLAAFVRRLQHIALPVLVMGINIELATLRYIVFH